MAEVCEVCVDSVQGAEAAAQGGAQRIELCSCLVEGGLTPSYGLMKMVRGAFPPPGKMMVLIRPRGGDFVYTQAELQVMRQDIEAAASLGADGVAVGCLTPEGDVDMDALSHLLHLATSKDLDLTFNRAFDMCRDLPAALEQLAAVGVKRVLTSGGQASALAGAGCIAQLVGLAGKRLAIMAGAGVTEENAGELVRRTGVRELHSTAKRTVFSSMKFRRPGMTMCATDVRPNDYAWGAADPERVSALISALKTAVAELPPEGVVVGQKAPMGSA